MTIQQKNSIAINIILWIAQAILATSLIWAAAMKLFQPVEKLSAMWPWVAQVPIALLKFTGIVDILGALGLILPALLHIRPKLTPIAAMGVIILMIIAIGFHVSRGEARLIGINIAFGIIAAFIAWGRFYKSPISAK